MSSLEDKSYKLIIPKKELEIKINLNIHCGFTKLCFKTMRKKPLMEFGELKNIVIEQSIRFTVSSSLQANLTEYNVITNSLG